VNDRLTVGIVDAGESGRWTVALVVQKFGGSSVADAERVKRSGLIDPARVLAVETHPPTEERIARLEQSYTIQFIY
jgi:Zn-dependent protease with chaperone function